MNTDIPSILDLLAPALDPFGPQVLALNDQLAHNPEISNEEHQSSAAIVAVLRQAGLEVEYPFGGEPTGFRAVIRGGLGSGPKIALLAEYDALPGVGHGCGHCASGSISVWAGLALHALRGRFAGEVHLIGTPDEEALGGKIRMARQGVFRGYDLALMMHMFNRNAVATPFLALDSIRFEFTGRASHAAASPWEGRNALNAVQLLFHASDMLRQHVKSDIRVHGVITKGGDAPNIVPDFASADFYTRGKLRSELDDVSEWLRDCGRAAALATRTQVKIYDYCPPLKNLTRNAPGEDLLRSLYAQHQLELTDESSLPLGSSDIGELDEYCPTFHPVINVRNDLVLHTRGFAEQMAAPAGHQAIVNGARIVAAFIWAVLQDGTLLPAIQADYRARRI